MTPTHEWHCETCNCWSPDLMEVTRCEECRTPRPDIAQYRRVKPKDPPLRPRSPDPVAGTLVAVAGLALLLLVSGPGTALGVAAVAVGILIALGRGP